jgi:exonuclease III
MAETYKITTLNINSLKSKNQYSDARGLHAKTRDKNHVLTGSHAQPMSDTIRGYAAYTNIGANRRGIAILTTEHTPLTKIMRLPSGRGMTAKLQGVWLVNTYATSGAEKRQEGEGLYNIDLPYLLRVIPTTIVGRDFNCVLTKTDCTAILIIVGLWSK